MRAIRILCVFLLVSGALLLMSACVPEQIITSRCGPLVAGEDSSKACLA